MKAVQPFLLSICVACLAFASEPDPLLRPLEHYAAQPSEQDEADLETIRQRLKTHYLEKVRSRGLDRAKRFAEALQSNGAWSDIAYVGHDRTSPVAMRHINRIARGLAPVYAELPPGSPEKAEIGSAISLAFEGWLKYEPYFENRYLTFIGGPRAVAIIMHIAGGALTEEQWQAALAMMRRGDTGSAFRFTDEPIPTTGTNLLWAARLQLEAGALAGDMAHLRRAADRLKAEVTIGLDEGPQHDGSFFQHGPQLMNGDYGQAFVIENILFASLLDGTRAAFAPELLERLESLVLDGSIYMMRGNRWFFSARGRAFTRLSNHLPSLARALEILATLPVSRPEALQQAARRIKDPTTEEPLVGHKHFWLSDTTTHHRPAHSYFLRMTSTDTEGTESGNGENLLGYYMGDGLTLRMSETENYDRIYPLLDWRRLPGVTCTTDQEPFPDFMWGKRTYGGSDFVGGATDGIDGVSCLDYDRAEVSGRKAWFFHEDHLVMLGNSLATAKPYPLQTTIHQGWAAQEAQVLFEDGEVQQLAVGQATHSPHIRQVSHRGYLYRILDGSTSVNASMESRRGEWDAINKPFSKAPPEQGDVFTLSIEHGESPTDASYAVSIHPQGKPPPQIVILSNSPNLQAVFFPEGQLLQVIFWEPGQVETPAGLLSVDQPCLVQWRHSEGQSVVHLACPLDSVSTVAIELQASAKLLKSSVSLPTDHNLGRSVKVAFHPRRD